MSKNWKIKGEEEEERNLFHVENVFQKPDKSEAIEARKMTPGRVEGAIRAE